MKVKNFIKTCEDLLIQDKGASVFELEKMKVKQFPQEHLALLALTDGLKFYGSYFRLFGTNPDQTITLDS